MISNVAVVLLLDLVSAPFPFGIHTHTMSRSTITLRYFSRCKLFSPLETSFCITYTIHYRTVRLHSAYGRNNVSCESFIYLFIYFSRKQTSRFQYGKKMVFGLHIIFCLRRCRERKSIRERESEKSIGIQNRLIYENLLHI